MAQKPNLIGKITGYFTYHRGDQSQRPLSMQNKSPFHKGNTIMGIASAVSFLLALIMQGNASSSFLMLLYGGAFAVCFTFAVFAQVAINKGNDKDWRMELMNKHKHNQMFG